MTDHKYVEHPTYTGPGCAMCGKSMVEHNPMDLLEKVAENSGFGTDKDSFQKVRDYCDESGGS